MTPTPDGPSRNAASTWQIVRRQSTAAEFHALPIPDPPTSQLWVHEITRPAVVLGSTQRDDVVDRDACRRAGVDVVRRRSGGGAVWLAPDEFVWVDVILPAGGPGWADDIHAPMVWLGERLSAAFDAAGAERTDVHRGPMDTTPSARLVCFGGLGPGELTLAGAKLVGMSQRRTRAAARLQCCWYVRHDHGDLTRFLAPDVVTAELRSVATIEPNAARSVPELLVSELA